MTCPHCKASIPDEARFCAACGNSLAATASLAPQVAPSRPSMIGRDIAGRYRLLALLGEGGMGAVYRAEQISLRRTVAIKVLRPELSADAGLVRRFNTEAELAAKLSHPNTVAIFDFGQDADGTLFIAMEHVEGESLRAVVQRGPLDVARAVGIAAQIAASLIDAHARGIVHRDLKPDNVMLTRRGRDQDVVRVLDFGIAKLRDDGRTSHAQLQQMTQAGDMLGTPQYMAPEQIRGETVDGRTDVYALGAITYEMLTGRMPFEGPTVMAILSKHLTELPQQPSLRRPDLGLAPAVDAVVMRALIKDLEFRTPSMEHFAEELAELGGLTGQYSAMARPTSRPPGVPMTPTEPRSVTPLPVVAQPSAVVTAPAMATAARAPFSFMPAPAASTPTATPRTRPTSGSSNKGMVIGLGVLAAAGLGVGIWAATRDDGGTRRPISAVDPWTAPRPAGALAIVPGTVPTATLLTGYPVYSNQGWGVRLPDGFVSQPSAAGVVAARGSGEAIVCADIEATVPYELDALVREFTTTTQMQVLAKTKSMEDLLGAPRPHAIFRGDDPATQVEGVAEVVAYRGPGFYFSCAYVAAAGAFDAMGALRTELFSQRVLLPAPAAAPAGTP